MYDMEKDYPGMCKVINAWVSEKTGGRITDLMDPNDRPDVPYFLMMLVNAQTRGAAEVLAGALRAQDRCIVIGSRTAGTAVA